jgi:hypothetical protein
MATSRDIFALGGERQPAGGDPPAPPQHAPVDNDEHSWEKLDLDNASAPNVAGQFGHHGGGVQFNLQGGANTFSLGGGGSPPGTTGEYFTTLGGGGRRHRDDTNWTSAQGGGTQPLHNRHGY